MTPERALELAEQIEAAIKSGEFVDEGLPEATDCVAILRHYAEIMRAEPVFTNNHSLDELAEVGKIPYMAQLIIKPVPPRCPQLCAPGGGPVDVYGNEEEKEQS